MVHQLDRRPRSRWLHALGPSLVTLALCLVIALALGGYMLVLAAAAFGVVVTTIPLSLAWGNRARQAYLEGNPKRTSRMVFVEVGIWLIGLITAPAVTWVAFAIRSLLIGEQVATFYSPESLLPAIGYGIFPAAIGLVIALLLDSRILHGKSARR